MSQQINDQIIDAMAERLDALSEVLKPSAMAHLQAELQALLAHGHFDLAEELLTKIEEEQDV